MLSTRKQLFLKHRNGRGKMMYKFLLPLKKLSLIPNKGTVSTWTQFQDFKINRTPGEFVSLLFLPTGRTY